MRDWVILGALALSIGVTVDGRASAAPPAVRLCDGVFTSVSGLTDYRFNGFSESNRRPTWQATAYCYRNDGYFVGTTWTGVDFEDEPRTRFEADWYGGRQWREGRYQITATLLYASFPDKRAPGHSFDILEPEVEVARTFGRRVTLKGLAAWSTSATQRDWQVKASAAYQLTPWLKLDADVGRVWADPGVDHELWDIGATATWRRVSLGAHYGGQTLTRSQCYFTDWCAPGPSLSVTYRLLP